jgi:hypothetical protein
MFFTPTSLQSNYIHAQSALRSQTVDGNSPQPKTIAIVGMGLIGTPASSSFQC